MSTAVTAKDCVLFYVYRIPPSRAHAQVSKKKLRTSPTTVRGAERTVGLAERSQILPGDLPCYGACSTRCTVDHSMLTHAGETKLDGDRSQYRIRASFHHESQLITRSERRVPDELSSAGSFSVLTLCVLIRHRTAVACFQSWTSTVFSVPWHLPRLDADPCVDNLLSPTRHRLLTRCVCSIHSTLLLRQHYQPESRQAEVA